MSEYLLGSEDPAYVAFEVTSAGSDRTRSHDHGDHHLSGGQRRDRVRQVGSLLILHRGSLDWVVDGVEFKET